MSKKKLNVASIKNELEGGASLFFRPSSPAQPKPEAEEPAAVNTISPTLQPALAPPHPGEAHPAEDNKAEPSSDTTTPRYHDTTVSQHHDTAVSRPDNATVALIRKAVKEFGKEAATHRFTLDEKRAVADIIHAFKGRGVKTSENEIARIAINFLLNDYRINGEQSILTKVISALNE